MRSTPPSALRCWPASALPSTVFSCSASRPHGPPHCLGAHLMLAYIARRLVLMIPTLFGIMLISFVIVQFAPGGPVERILAQLQGTDAGATSRIAGGASGDFGGGQRAQPSAAPGAT